MIEQETVWKLLCDPAHWIFELILLVIFDFLIGVCLWPAFKRWVLHHKSDDKKIKILEAQVKELRKIVGLDKE